MKQEIILESADLNLQAQAWGNPSKPRLLALHGWLDNSASFQPLAEILTEYYVLAPDLIGHGHSPHLSNNILYTLEAHVAVLLAALDKIGWKKFSVLGHSLGAGIGMALTAALPERITQLIMLDKLGPPALGETNYLEQFLLNMQSITRITTARQVFYQTEAEAVAMRCYMSGCSEQTARLMTARDLKSTDTGFMPRSDRRLQFKSHRSLTESQCQTLLRTVQCPTLLIKAQSGMLAGRDLSERAACLKQLKIIEVAGGHHVHIDNPQRIAAIITTFLAETEIDFENKK